ncbi:MAG TPA: 3-hydroxyacyl-ACP dehydratase FabZ family protein [Planctomycetota bacterium]|jgi:3-hydroxyacyl-[acyl-carrier-protein] dehydratase|nr:3-hydroxyacyl-ACP dehydratase FabZ family protein [Planctomycetota bacterium]
MDPDRPDPGAPLEALPHRPPFRFVDEVLEVSPGERIEAARVFRPTEDFFRGHFPGDPLVPGVLLVECMAQAAGLAEADPGGARLARIEGARFLRPVRPGDRVVVSMRRAARFGPVVRYEGECRVEGSLVAEGTVTLRTGPGEAG